jgi:hypothetical protein
MVSKDKCRVTGTPWYLHNQDQHSTGKHENAAPYIVWKGYPAGHHRIINSFMIPWSSLPGKRNTTNSKESLLLHAVNQERIQLQLTLPKISNQLHGKTWQGSDSPLTATAHALALSLLYMLQEASRCARRQLVAKWANKPDSLCIKLSH